jgi:hypothetical protein
MILNGKLSSLWIDQLNHRSICQRRLLKEIRANLFLGWLIRHFPGLNVVFLIRHPCAYAVSRVRQGFDVDSVLLDMVSQPELVEDFLEPHLPLLHGLTSPFEKHVFQWCVEQAVPLKTLRTMDVLPVFYEEICVLPEQTFRTISEHIGNTSGAILDLDYDRMSSTAQPWSSRGLGEERATSWRKHIGSADRERAMTILKHFELYGLYDEGPWPHRKVLNGLFGNQQGNHVEEGPSHSHEDVVRDS